MSKERTPILTRKQVQDLSRYRPKPYLVTTLYLDVDRTGAPGRHGVLRKLIREAKSGLDERTLTRKQRQSVDEDLATLERIARDARARGARAFCAILASGLDYQVVVDLPYQVKNRLVFGETPFTRPLAAALDEYPRYLVALVDRAQARLLAVHMARVREILEVASDVPAQVKEGGRHGLDERRIERHIDDHVLRHLKRVAEVVREVTEERDFDLIILGGPDEAVSGLRDLVNPALRPRLAGEVPVPVSSTPDQVLAAAQTLVSELNGRRDQELLRRLDEAVEGSGAGVAGVAAVLGALRRGAVAGLLVAGDFEASGVECRNCGFLALDGASCPACGAGSMRALPNLVAEVIDRATDAGADVWHVASEPAVAELRTKGGIAALLRFKLV